jgi:hypothetical protein
MQRQTPGTWHFTGKKVMAERMTRVRIADWRKLYGFSLCVALLERLRILGLLFLFNGPLLHIMRK